MHYISETVHYVLVVFMALLPIANPFSTAPLFVGLTANADDATRRKVALRAAIYMSAVLLLFLFAGVLILDFFGVTIGGLRIAGGIVIMVIGLRMLFPDPHQPEADNAEVSEEAALSMAFTPLTMPMLSGPGSIAVVITMAARVAQQKTFLMKVAGYVDVALGILLTAVVCWLVLRASTKVVKFLGKSGIDALTRIMGFFLVAIGVEFFHNGLKGMGLLG